LQHCVQRGGIGTADGTIDEVFDVQQPIQRTQRISSLGSAIYLRYHIGNMDHVGAPIHRQGDDEAKSKHQLLKWTEEAEEAYLAVQRAVSR
jgi:hypothetical protein